jgi:predicted methyltransferase
MIMKRTLAALAIVLAPIAWAAPVERDAAGFPRPDRPVAAIVSPIWSNEAHRNAAGETGQVIRALKITKGMSVADIGAGSGYYMRALSNAVGDTGRVYAQDVMDEYVAKLRKKAAGRKNVTVILGAFDDPKLPARSVDIALMVHMYHEIEQPFGVLYRLAGSMKPGGVLGVVELVKATAMHGAPPGLLKCELEAVGYKQISKQELSGGVGYLAIFAAPAAPSAPAAIQPCKA